MFNSAIDPCLMQMLICIAEEQNLTAAGRRLLLTQQAVSAQVKKLEALTGRRLVHRTPQEVRLTQDGEALLVYARQIIEISERLKKQFGHADPSGSIGLGFTPGFGTRGLFPILSELKRLRPRLEIHFETLKTECLISKLEAGHLDIIIGAQRPGEKRGEILFCDKLVWIGSPSHFAEPEVPVPLVLQPGPAIQRDMVFGALSAAHRSWTIRFESDDLISQRAAVLAGWGVSAHPHMLLADTGVEPIITGCSPLPDLGRVEFFIRQRGGNDRIVECFSDLIRGTAKILEEDHKRQRDDPPDPSCRAPAGKRLPRSMGAGERFALAFRAPTRRGHGSA